MALRKIRVSEQCTQFTRTGERCSLSVMEGNTVCALHAGHLAIDKIDERAPLSVSSSQRDVSRRVLGAIARRWPENLFSVKKGFATSGQEVLVICWKDGPTEKQVHAEIAGLFSQVALGWGMPQGAPGIECSREFSPVVLVAALIEEAIVSQPDPPARKVEHTWVRKILVPALGRLQHVEEPSESIPEALLVAAERIIDRCPPADTPMDHKWLAQVTIFALTAADGLREDYTSLK